MAVCICMVSACGRLHTAQETVGSDGGHSSTEQRAGQDNVPDNEQDQAGQADSVGQTQIKERLLSAVDGLEKSRQLYFEQGLTITGLGSNYSEDPIHPAENYYFPAIEKLTGCRTY